MATNYDSRDLQAADTTILATAVAVANAAVALPTTAMAQRKTVLVFNNAAIGGQTVFLGSSAVTTATGIPLLPQASIALDLGAHLALNGICAAATPTSDVRILEIA